MLVLSLLPRSTVGFNELVVPRHDRANIRVQVIRKVHPAGVNSPFNDVLPELFLRALLQKRQKVILDHAHNVQGLLGFIRRRKQSNAQSGSGKDLNWPLTSATDDIQVVNTRHHLTVNLNLNPNTI